MNKSVLQVIASFKTSKYLDGNSTSVSLCKRGNKKRQKTEKK